MDYTEYYELFKQYPECEVEHENHKEGFDGKRNFDLEKAIIKLVAEDETLFLYQERTFNFSMLLLNKQYADLDFWVCTTHALHDISEHKQGLLDDGDYRLYFEGAEGPIEEEEEQGYLCDLPLNVRNGHFNIEEFEQILDEIMTFEGAIEDTYYIEELIDNGRTYTEDGETFKVLDCSHNN
jgi:hypothetical protein